MKVGILSVQGNYEAHARVLERLGVSFCFVKQPQHLTGLTGLILPGGESTTMLHFLQNDNFLEAIQEFALAGRCLFGTCAGAILLAKEVSKPEQTSLKLVDIAIERNAYGRQLNSQIVRGNFLDQEDNLEMVFIRAPRIIKVGASVEVFATYQGNPVGVIQQNWMLTTFHPEMTSDLSVHNLFLAKCCQGPSSHESMAYS
jgi:pyridoxal 5'-phosphate synthase pdxT subunit